MKRVLILLASLAAPLALAGQVHADGLPSLTSAAACTNNQTFPEANEGATSCSIAGVTASISLSPAIVITSFAQGQGPDTAVGSGANVQYSFEVTGPSPGTQVPLIIFTNMGASEVGDAGASADIIVTADPGNSAAMFNASQSVCENSTADACAGEDGSFSGALHVTAPSGIVGNVGMGISTGATDDGTANVFIDPMIEIDPDFTNTGGLYKLILSTGAGNALPVTGGVPEPASWVLMLAGLGMVGGLMRRARRLTARGDLAVA